MLHNMSSKGKPRRPVSIIVLVWVFLGMVVIGADIIALSLRPLNYLGVSYPAILGYANFIMPPIAFVLWLLIGRKRPLGIAVLALLLCGVAIMSVPEWADRQVDQVKITKSIDDITPLEKDRKSVV